VATLTSVFEDRQRTGADRADPPLAMVIGPTRPAPSVLARLDSPAPPLTDPGFLAEFGYCLAALRELAGAGRARAVVIPGSGTNGMESMAASLLRPGVPVLVASTGMWGDRWREICLRHGIPAYGPRSAVGRAPDAETLERLLSQRPCQAVLVAQVDSSSGVRVDLAEMAELAHRHGALLLADGVSAVGAEQVEFDDWDLDGYLGAPPKGLAAPAGLAFFLLSERAQQVLRSRDWQPATYSLDLAPWLPVMSATERGEFGYFQSPAGTLVVALAEALRLALGEGRTARVERHARLRDILHAGLAALGISLLVPDPADRANGVTVAVVPGGLEPAPFLDAVAAEGVVLPAGTLPATGTRTFRIGHLGTVDEADIHRTLDAVARALGELRSPV
jgi:alanine-glyoxylate transaminase/serine-glyoxylate transaminase/serine-pyruvate transaminase